MLTAEQVAGWERDGFLALPGFFTPAEVARVQAVVDDVYARPPGWVVVDGTVSGRRARLADVGEAERAGRRFKLNDLYLERAEVRGVALDGRVRAVLRQLLGEPAVLCNSLNFETGSGQPEHVDSLYMTPRTPGKLAATWVALEDAHPDAGQLFYYPGSHRLPRFTFSDGSHHAAPAEMGRWRDHMTAAVAAAGLTAERFAARTGDLFVWAADLLHGGSPIADPARTRKSVVCHYFALSDCRAMGYDLVPEGADGYWYRRPHPPLEVVPPPPTLRQRVGRWLRKVGLRPNRAG